MPKKAAAYPKSRRPAHSESPAPAAAVTTAEAAHSSDALASPRKKSTSNAKKMNLARREYCEALLAEALRKPAPTAHGIQQKRKEKANQSGCHSCETTTCCCNLFKKLLEETYNALSMKRVTEIAGKRDACAKSILPIFVSRLARILKVTPEDTFIDLGSGNGSVLFQVAFMTGAPCIGVELSAHNAELSRRAWDYLRPKLEELASKPMPKVTIVTGDIAEFITAPGFGRDGKLAIWTANLLLPKSLTQFMAERFRTLPKGARIACFDDLYPHSRSIARLRDPELFELFEMEDYEWPEEAVEWCYATGKFYVHRKKV